MSLNEVTVILQEMLMTTLLVIAPMLLTSLAVGLGISIVQAATQIHEQTLTFIPKIVLVLGVLGAFFPWIMGRIVQFATHIMYLIAHQVNQ